MKRLYPFGILYLLLSSMPAHSQIIFSGSRLISYVQIPPSVGFGDSMHYVYPYQNGSHLQNAANYDSAIDYLYDATLKVSSTRPQAIEWRIYDTLGHLVADTSMSGYKYSMATVNTYDPFGHLLSDTQFQYDGAKLYSYSLTLNKYDVAGNAISTTKLQRDTARNLWLITVAYVNAYDNKNNLIIQTAQSPDASGNLQDASRIFYTYTQQDSLSTKIVQAKNTTTNTWNNTATYTSYKYSNNRIDSVTIYNISVNSLNDTTFSQVNKYIYSYDSLGQLISDLRYSSHNYYTHGDYFSNFVNGKPQTISGYNYSRSLRYNSFGQVTIDTFLHFNFNTFDNDTTIYRYYYETYSDTVNMPVAVANTNLTVNVFPIPADNVLNVSISAPAPGIFNLTLVNMLGQVMQQYNTPMVAAYNASLSVNSFASGIYFLEVSDGYDRQIKKFVVRH